MRIISGIARGLKLKSPPGSSQSIRPTSDRSREALFSILQHRLEDAVILDLFAGTGALGLEALSRGASQAHFVDNNQVSINIIKANIHSYLQCVSNSELLVMPETSVYKKDLRNGLTFLQPKHETCSQTYDLIFVDPPYSKGLSHQLLEILDRGFYLRKNGMLIIEESSQEMLTSSLVSLTLSKKRQYGDTSFWFFEKTEG